MEEKRALHKFPVINQIEIRPNVSTRCQLSTSHWAETEKSNLLAAQSGEVLIGPATKWTLEHSVYFLRHRPLLIPFLQPHMSTDSRQY